MDLLTSSSTDMMMTGIATSFDDHNVVASPKIAIATTYGDIVDTRPYHAMSDVEMDEQPRRSGRQRKATQQYGNTKDVEGDEDGKSACSASWRAYD